MSQQSDISKLLKKMYTNSVHLEEWRENPKETTEKWQITVDEQNLDTIKTVVDHISTNLEQVQEVRYVNQYTVKKISDMTRHGVFSYYMMMALHIVTFIVGIVVFCFGIYAFFQGHAILGCFLSFLSAIPVGYFLLTKPLQELNANIGNLVQMQVALGAWFNEMTYWQVYAKEPDLEERQMVAQTMRDATKWAVMLIEDYTSHRSEKRASGKSYAEVIDKIRGLAEKWKSDKSSQDRLLLEKKEPKNSTTAEKKSSSDESPREEKAETEDSKKEDTTPKDEEKENSSNEEEKKEQTKDEAAEDVDKKEKGNHDEKRKSKKD
ncbi:hypothetical protein [Candidatus Uabimicrobium amorphum]|uniref:Uncharacterized protein n=1 Tax=Uabimicrobium amorphum TaxID=2596890 RepID=A0A5S9F2P2_UABAM|nr:hypothetical protein [Candidatus Uabimicrobium amorphum]BBM82332.1 hypothetical protein UABAM_00675 [Candidatus Uabimicrobium amorphum]